MKRLGVFLMALSLTAFVQAQDEEKGRASFFSKMAEKNILNHMDIGASVGTMGIGIDVAVPVGDYVRVRAGYNYMPAINFHSKYDIQTRGGSIGNIISKISSIDKKLQDLNIDINSESLSEYKALFDKFGAIEPKDYVRMGMEPNLHQFKFLVDVMPFRNNKHWSFTAGFFVGPSDVGYSKNLSSETLLLDGINTYNRLYANYPEYGINGIYLHNNETPRDDPFYRYGLAGFNLGKFDDGMTAMMVPGKDNTVRAEMKVSKFRPYLGFGYNTHLSKDKKWNMNVDAGIMFLCGSPSVYVDNVYKIDTGKVRFDENGQYLGGIGFDDDNNYYGEIVRWNEDELEYVPSGELVNHVDMVHDLHDIPGKVGNRIKTISRFKVYPNVSVTFSYRIF